MSHGATLDLDGLAVALMRWLPGQRWFAGKSRQIRRVSIVDAASLGVDEARLELVLIDVEYGTGDPEQYFVPLRAVGLRASEIDLQDALLEATCSRALLEAVARSEIIQTNAGGAIRFVRGPAFDEAESTARVGAFRPLGLEQSNTSVVFDERVLLKAFRRVPRGPNPDLEVPRFLATRTTFDRLPNLVGWFDYIGSDGSEASLGILQEFVRSEGDGWSWALSSLSRLRQSDSSDSESYLAGLAMLGCVTADLHLALSSAPDQPDFAPAPVTFDDALSWRAEVVLRLDLTLSSLRQLVVNGGLPIEARASAVKVLEHREALVRRADSLLSAPTSHIQKTRYHGDYHLGQVLKVEDGWLVLDFEGEPLRPLDERRAKHTPLKDVAGMLRSFNYARHAALQRGSASAERLLEWEIAARETFLQAYFAQAGSSAVFLPSDHQSCMRIIESLELQKAAYELDYELNSRPEWLMLPLTFLADLAGS